MRRLWRLLAVFVIVGSIVAIGMWRDPEARCVVSGGQWHHASGVFLNLRPGPTATSSSGPFVIPQNDLHFVSYCSG